MTQQPDVGEVAGALRVSIGLLLRRLRQTPVDGGLTLPESSVMAKLDLGGPTTPSALARLEQITPQSMGATIAGLESRGLVERRPDPGDGRRVVFSITPAGQQVLRNRRDARTEQLAHALSTGFSKSELTQLMAAVPLLERLASHI
jgi:DNA-binding MarR family transcriptional regulator